jgi:beta propeller repeat protein
MFPRKYNPKESHVVIKCLSLLVLWVWSNPALSAWQPPIGIPAPSFGINETVDMYNGQQYTFSDGRGTINYPISSVSGKPYTHYIDNTHPSATDSGNTYGTEAAPRNTIPTTLAPGSVVEIHGGPYTYGSRIWTWTSQGTSVNPVFIRGWDDNNINNFPTIQGKEIRFNGTYLIIENIDFVNTNLVEYAGHSVFDHITIRNNEMHGRTSPTGSVIGLGDYRHVNPVNNHTVIYNNHIYDNGMPRDKYDHHGIAVMDYCTNVWIVDNHMHDNDGDSIQVNAAAGQAAVNGEHAQYVYIGRNVMHHDTENAIDLKDSEHVIISQNTMYGYRNLFDSDGTALLPGNEGGRLTWVLFNDIYDSQNGIRIDDEVLSNTSYIIGNKIHDMLGHGIITYRNMTLHMINNVFYNIPNSGFVSWFAQHAIVGATYDSDYSFVNNIFYEIGNYDIEIDDGSGMSALTDRTPMSNNLFYRTTGQIRIKWADATYNSVASFISGEPTKGSGCIEADPLFTDPANYDFTLQSTSPAIDAGTSSGIVQQAFDTFQTLYGIDIRKDIDGNPRVAPWDIGVYEGSSSDPTNPTPVLGPIGNKSVNENTTLTFNVSATDNDPITYSAQNLPSGATFSGQNFSWTPSYSQAGSYSVTFRASDGNSQDSETITITVNNVNRSPVLSTINDKSVNENALLSFSVSATDPDGQTLTYSVSGLPSGAVFASQTFTWTPSYDQAGIFTLTFTADDGQAQDSDTIAITVINVNRAPVLAAINNQSAWTGNALTFSISATDPDGDSVTYSASGLPAGAAFNATTFDWTPTHAQTGTYSVTFYASDGQLQDSQVVTIDVGGDTLAPTVTNLSPADGTIQVPLNNLIILSITDSGIGIDPDSVRIEVGINGNPNNTVYSGDKDSYTSAFGDCQRIGDSASYQFIYQPVNDMFYYDQTVSVTVNAADIAGNAMNEYSYSFATEMHLFGQNKQVNTSLDSSDKPATVRDSSGNIWAAWHTGAAGSRDIYIGKKASGTDNFSSAIQLTSNAADQCNPAIAIDSNGKLYVVWQDNRNGNWDIYLSTSTDGMTWSAEKMVNAPETNPTPNQINPSIAIDSQSPNRAYVVWQDDSAGNQDIYVASSNDSFTTKTVTQITSNSSDQVEPAVAADSANGIYIVWTDSRNGSTDIYGAASNSGPWTNVPIVNNANNQSSPAIAAESTGSALHLLWIDDTPGDNDIYYVSSNNGLPGSPVTGSSIIDDTSGAGQSEPAIAVTGASSTNDLKVFVCWQDYRNADTDLYFAELSTGSGTNVFVNDGGSNAHQDNPAIGIDQDSNPYLIWADDRSANRDIYYAGSTCLESTPLASATVDASAPGTTIIGVDPQTINDVDDVSISLPSGSCSYNVKVSIAEISNRQTFAVPCLGGYEFGPSGIQFNQPVTITIPYVYSESYGSTVPYWFNPLTGTLSQQGITNIRDIEISPTLHAVCFETTHFTPFYLLGDGGGLAAALGGGGGGGGCSISAGNEGNIFEFAVPYVILAVVMIIIRIRDVRCRRARCT